MTHISQLCGKLSLEAGGRLYNGPGGGLYDGPGGGMYTGPSSNPCQRYMPPWPVLMDVLRQLGMHEYIDLILAHRPPNIRW